MTAKQDQELINALASARDRFHDVVAERDAYRTYYRAAEAFFLNLEAALGRKETSDPFHEARTLLAGMVLDAE